MAEYDYDLFVIGAGSGGVRAARMAGGFGAKVAIAEERYLGGTCVNVGCIPKKLFVYAAHYAEDFHDAAGYGWQISETNFNWNTLLNNKNNEIKRLNGIYTNLLKRNNVVLYDGRAVLTGPNTVRINGEDISAGRILVATGGWPHIPDMPGRNTLSHPTRRSFWKLFRTVRSSLAVGISQLNLPASSTVLAWILPWSTAATCSCGASTGRCGSFWPNRCA